MVEYCKKLELKESYDVLVSGGGPAGVAAAVAVAKQGLKVLLVEQSGCLGGMGTLGMVPEFMCFDDGINLLAGGVGTAIKRQLFGNDVNYECYNIRAEELKRAYDKLLLDAGVKFLFFSKVVDVVKDGKRIDYAVVTGKSGSYAVKAKCYIDCTGEGFLSAVAGAEFEYGNENGVTMPSTLCSFWSGIDFDKKNIPDGARIGNAYLDGVLSVKDLLLPGIKETDRKSGVGGGNVGHCFNVNELDDQNITDAMVYGRKSLAEYQEYYRKYIPGCENAYLCLSAPVLGVREGRRIKGKFRMEYKHYLTRAVFDDEIGRYNYPIDIHPMNADDKSVKEFDDITALKYEKGESYGISLGCLIVDGFDNLFVAGKCVSADREMQASMRVMPCCFITGQAAGVAASVCVIDEKTADNVDVKKVQKRLIDMGAYLPNAKV